MASKTIRDRRAVPKRSPKPRHRTLDGVRFKAGMTLYGIVVTGQIAGLAAWPESPSWDIIEFPNTHHLRGVLYSHGQRRVRMGHFSAYYAFRENAIHAVVAQIEAISSHIDSELTAWTAILGERNPVSDKQ